MKKYTDTELLEAILPMLHYTVITCNLPGTVDFKISENICRYVDKDFVVALENRVNNLLLTIANKITVKGENSTADENTEYNDGYKEEQKMNGTCMPTEDNRDYKEEYRKTVEENRHLKVIIELLLKEIDHLR